MGDDDDRWAEAQSLLDSVPTEPAERRLRGWRRRRVLAILAGLLLLGVPVGVGTYVLTGSSTAQVADVPPWQGVAGLTLAAVGTLVMGAGIVAQFRVNKRTSAWRSPLAVLTRQQRKELGAAVRGRAEVPPDRLPLARHVAWVHLLQRAVLPMNVGLTLFWAGQTIAAPAWWRVAVAGLLVVVTGVSVPLLLRQERQARRFLAEHPDPRVVT